ncbi:conserved hypothetical protein [Klebsiella pneumoniae subsp. pneumoniae T69]|nr:conserved hypothetical protein [Klebsiella pneumoniae subsp. pneumoniae T69]
MRGSRRKWLPAGRGTPAPGDMAEADQAFGENLLENVNEAHKYVLPLSTPPATLPIILGFAFLRRFRGERECELRC